MGEPDGSNNVGMACHIVGARNSARSPRNDPSVADETRRSPNNGIWLCYTHGKMVDGDTHRFSKDTLRRWKEIATSLAAFELELGKELSATDLVLRAFDLAPSSRPVTLPGENEVIGQALEDACVDFIWGSDLNARIRNVLIEVTRNAFAHGDASYCELTISGRSIALSFDGPPFDPRRLPKLPNARGGAAAVELFLQNHGESVAFHFLRRDEVNRVYFVLANGEEELCSETDCVVRIDRSRNTKRPTTPILAALAHCSVVYVLVPRYLSISDIVMAAEHMQNLRKAAPDKTFVLVSDGISEDVLGLLQRRCGSIDILRLR